MEEDIHTQCVWGQTAEENVWPMTDDVTQEWRKIYIKNVHNMHSLPNIQWESAVTSTAYYEHAALFLLIILFISSCPVNLIV